MVTLIVAFALFWNSPRAESQESRAFEIKFERVIAEEPLWGDFVGLSANGPYFVDETSFVLLDWAGRWSGQVRRYFLSDEAPRDLSFAQGSPTLLYKLGGRVYLQAGDRLLVYQEGRFEETAKRIKIADSWDFVLGRGLVETTDREAVTRIPYQEYVRSLEMTFITLPEANQQQDALYFLSSNYENPGEFDLLVRYDLNTKAKRVLRDDAFFFSSIPGHPAYLLVWAGYGKHQFSRNEFQGDFVILDQQGRTVQAFDAEDYKHKREFSLLSFDINSKGEMAAVGSYSDYTDPEDPKRYGSILLLSIARKGK